MVASEFLSKNPRFCSHAGKMTFAKRNCICSSCKQMWTLGEFGWEPDDDDYEYRPRPKFRRKKKK